MSEDYLPEPRLRDIRGAWFFMWWGWRYRAWGVQRIYYDGWHALIGCGPFGWSKSEGYWGEGRHGE